MNKIKFLLFDLTGVLVHKVLNSPTGYKINGKLFLRQELEPIFISPSYLDYMLGQITHSEFMADFIKTQNLDLSLKEFDQILESSVIPVEGMPELIKKLSKKFHIVLVNNEGRVFSETKIKNSGAAPFIHSVISSWKIGLIKPDPLFFQKVLAILETKPQECLFIDDSPKNVLAAKNLGIDSILFQNHVQLTIELTKRKIGLAKR